MSSLIHFQKGDNVSYNGKTAVVVEDYWYSNTLTIEVNGRIITVNRNDLFGMNDKKDDYFQDRLDECDEQIAENRSIIDRAKEIHAVALNTIKNCREQMSSILKACNVTSINQIADESQRKEYLSWRAQKSDAVTARNGATHDIICAAHNTGSVCFTKIGLINQQALSEYLA